MYELRQALEISKQLWKDAPMFSGYPTNSIVRIEAKLRNALELLTGSRS